MTDELAVSPASELARHGIGPAKPKGGRPARGRERQHIDDRRALVETLELAGASIRQIAEQVNVSIGTVQEDLRAIRRKRREALGVIDLEAERALELERLEQQRMWLSRQARQGSIGANRTLLRVSESKRRLLGLDAPVRVALEHDPYEAIRSDLDTDVLARLATRRRGEIIDITGTEKHLPDDDVD